MNEICAIIVTYNRPELLCRCVENLLKQDYSLDVLIYDNHSSLDTKGILLEHELLKENVTYYYADTNTGGAGGFHNAMKMAIKKDKYCALWLMDDDGYPVKTNTLSTVVEAWKQLEEKACILNSLVICDVETLRLSFSLDREYDGNVMSSKAVDGLLKDLVSPFNGTFVPTSVIKEMGYPIKEFFVYGDETEYTLRAKSKGIPLYTVVDSIYWHPTTVGKIKRFLHFQISIGNVPLWKTYCMARNTMFYTKKYLGIKMCIIKIVRMYLECFWVNEKRLKFKEITKGIYDGLKDDFSRQLDLSK